MPSEAMKVSLDRRAILFCWHNFGPMHDDRCAAAVQAFPDYKIYGIEISGVSPTYSWVSGEVETYNRITLYPRGEPKRQFVTFLRLFLTCLRLKPSAVFLCNYEKAYIFLTAVCLRVIGKRVMIMNDSKFDDFPRHLSSEIIKTIFYSPYHGAIACGARSKDYLRFLGLDSRSIFSEYNAIDIDRFESLVVAEHIAFSSRPFVIIARLVEKKNIVSAIAAYAFYSQSTLQPRRLIICGNGGLKDQLVHQVTQAGLSDLVEFRGFISEQEVAQILSIALCLILLSTEEQFGNAIIEAVALRIPVIISSACGAADDCVRSGVNGFVVEPLNIEGTAFFMKLLHSDELLWQKMRNAAQRFHPYFHVRAFTTAVSALIGRSEEATR